MGNYYSATFLIYRVQLYLSFRCYLLRNGKLNNAKRFNVRLIIEINTMEDQLIQN